MNLSGYIKFFPNDEPILNVVPGYVWSFRSFYDIYGGEDLEDYPGDYDGNLSKALF